MPCGVTSLFRRAEVGVSGVQNKKERANNQIYSPHADNIENSIKLADGT
jgi:hypothetical protein